MAMVINVTPLLANPIDIMHEIAAATRERAKPTLAVVMATDDFYQELELRRDLPPVYRFPESAARALAMLARYAAWRRRPVAGDAGVPAGREIPADDAAVAALLDRAGAGGYIGPAEAFQVLALYGIPVARWRLVAADGGAAAAGVAGAGSTGGESSVAGAEDGDVAAVLAAAAEIGYPVVLKGVAPDLVHKTEARAVRVDLRSVAELAEAVAAMRGDITAAGHHLSGYLVQEMAHGGHEVIFGVTTDPRFGPLLMFGLGGKYVEVFEDVRFGVLPLDAWEAGEMVRGIRGIRLLTGVRGEPGADLDLLVEVLLRIAQLVARHPRIVELDVNPFLAAPTRQAAKALDVRLRVERLSCQPGRRSGGRPIQATRGPGA
jgi:acyl-CoA synthetase (NDP forming)